MLPTNAKEKMNKESEQDTSLKNHVNNDILHKVVYAHVNQIQPMKIVQIAHSYHQWKRKQVIYTLHLK